MEADNVDFSTISNSKYETRYIINNYSMKFIESFTALNNKKSWYIVGHKTMDFIEDTLLGYVAYRGSEAFEELETEFKEAKAKLPPAQIRDLHDKYLDILYTYNRKRYKLVRKLLTRYNLDLYKNKVVAKD